MLVATKALVISSLRYSEADLIVSCYTETDGMKSYMLRNILKSKKGKLRTSLFQPLTQLEMVANHKNKGALEYVREAKIIHPYQSLHSDVYKSSLVLFLSEILKNTIKEEEANAQLFRFLTYSFQWLDIHETYADFHILFLLKLSRYLGFYPDASHEERPYFNLQEGTFQNHFDNHFSAEGDEVEALKRFFNKDFNNLTEIRLPKKTRTATLNLMLTYYQYHSQGFKTPKSLAVLQQLFN
ncbi:DNA repair protein RecO [Marixanthomonas spongiae]|uniref:DNA repair protein RecO n=1 Tax=Marixanthomonas spongiae TaxID=2174845 RepID=A0A2U0HZ53_9FLAO|nr:DNA repair protein RecO [Marixanthomonas spongiae]PVW14099.1 DNA repair protein RecO [Marixanthomonas spongiae]